MVLVVEDGTGVPGAESWVTVAEADAYLEKMMRPRPTKWFDATQDEKEVGLRRGAQYLATHYSGTWRGTIANRDQDLPFPRIGLIDSEGRYLDDYTIPTRIKHANIEAALREVQEPGALDGDLDSGARVQSESVSADGVSVSTTYATGKLVGRREFPRIHALVAILTNRGRLRRS